MLLAYVLIFLLHLFTSTCHATSRNQHLFFAGRSADADDATALSPAAMIHRHHHGHTAKAEVLSDYNDDVRHYHPAMMARWGGRAAPPRPPSTLPSVELAGIGGAPPPSLSAVEHSGVEGVVPPPPPPQGKHEDTSAAMEPSPPPMPSSSPHGESASASSSDSSATEKEASAASGDVDVDADYDGPMTHPPSHN